MYRIKVTKAARRLAKQYSAKTGVPPDQIIMESRSGPDRQVGPGEVDRWMHNKTQWLRRDQPMTQKVVAPPLGAATPSIPPGTTLVHAEDYPAIVAWGEFMYSSPEYIQGQLQIAAADRAAPGVVFKRHRRWVNLREVRAHVIRQFFWANHPELATKAWEK